jgi:hypothetical protein
MEHLIKHDIFDVEHDTEESIYILKEYGLNAWLDINALNCEDNTIILRCLNEVLTNLEEAERYEDCIYLRDIIIPMF